MNEMLDSQPLSCNREIPLIMYMVPSAGIKLHRCPMFIIYESKKSRTDSNELTDFSIWHWGIFETDSL